jgi:hypothetical protein
MENTPSPVNSPEYQDTPHPVRLKRPWSVTLLALGVLIITVINLARFILSLRYWSFLASQPGPSPLYLVLTGLVWAVAGSLLLWGLWKPATWAPRLMEAEVLTYALYYWLDLLFVRDHPVNGAPVAVRAVLPINWQYSAIVTVICLVYIVWALGRPKVNAYFAQGDRLEKANHTKAVRG